jgi:hypothetical protein
MAPNVSGRVMTSGRVMATHCNPVHGTLPNTELVGEISGGIFKAVNSDLEFVGPKTYRFLLAQYSDSSSSMPIKMPRTTPRRTARTTPVEQITKHPRKCNWELPNETLSQRVDNIVTLS